MLARIPGTPVDDRDYQVPFRFTGKLERLTLELSPVSVNDADRQMLHEKSRRNNSAAQ